MMTENEKLSLLLDDYADADSEKMLAETIDDINLQYRVRRYRMIGETMRSELPDSINLNFHSQVMQQINDEEKPRQLKDASSRQAALSSGWFNLSWLKPASGLAVAAAVAVITVTTWQSQTVDSFDSGDSVQITDAKEKIDALKNMTVDSDVVTVSTSGNGMRWKQAESADLQIKLNGYLVNHTEHSNSVQGIIPQARVVGFDTQIDDQ